jgi:signal transduction histidine kinase
LEAGATVEELRRAAPTALGVAIHDAAGRVVASAGDVALPGAEASGVVSARAGRIAVTLPAPWLEIQRRASRRLVPWVAAIVLAILIVVLLFVGRLLGPYQALLARAERLSASGRLEPPRGGDEAAFLIATFERAARALEAPDQSDAAERRAAAESLRRVGEVAAGVAHELRNGLAVIRGYVDLLARGAKGRGESELDEIRSELDALQRVINDLLTFARPGAARSERIDLAEITAAAARDAGLRGAAIRFHGAADGLWVTGDRQLLERSVRNLLRNAFEAGGAAPIDVTLEGEAGQVRVVVDDRGPGFPPALRETLGEPFATARPGGVGLGLAIVRRAAVLHGGRVDFGERPGGGARVVVSLPADAGS